MASIKPRARKGEHQVPDNTEQVFLSHVVFHPKLMGILTLLGVCGAVLGGHRLAAPQPESPKLPEPIIHWNCVNLLLIPTDQQPAISQA